MPWYKRHPPMKDPTTWIPEMPDHGAEPTHTHHFQPWVTVRPGFDKTWIVDIDWVDSYVVSEDVEAENASVSSKDEMVACAALDQMIQEGLVPGGKEVVRYVVGNRH